MNIQKNVSLKTYNTFGIDVKCRQLICIEDNKEIECLFQHNIFDEYFYILGGGSNVLFTHDFEGAILRMETQGIEKVKENEDNVYVKVAAGEI
jgi:UDP-N-acetylmuramate dehydrogenase